MDDHAHVLGSSRTRPVSALGTGTPTSAETHPPADAGELVRRAATGDQRAWADLVDRYTPMLWGIARGYRLTGPDAADVVQVAWLRLLQHLPRLREPHGVGGWLATTVRRESLTLIRRRHREPSYDLDDEAFSTRQADTPPVDEDLLSAERTRVVRRAMTGLSPRQQLVLRMLAADPPRPYQEISAATGIPIGSIGPTRARALQRLRTLLERDGALVS